MKNDHEDSHYIVTYRDPENLTEQKNITLRVKKISDSNLGLSFICLSQFIFESGPIILDPKADKLKIRFENTKSLHLSIYSIISIEEVGASHQGLNLKDKSNLFVIPKDLK